MFVAISGGLFIANMSSSLRICPLHCEYVLFIANMSVHFTGFWRIWKTSVGYGLGWKTGLGG